MEYSLYDKEFEKFIRTLNLYYINLEFPYLEEGDEEYIIIKLYDFNNNIKKSKSYTRRLSTVRYEIEDKFPFDIKYEYDIDKYNTKSNFKENSKKLKNILKSIHPQLQKEYKIAMRNKRYGENAEEKVRMKWLNRRLNRNLKVNNTIIKKVKI